MSDDPYGEIHAALQHCVALMQNLADQLARDMEDPAPLGKILTLTEHLTEMFRRGEIPRSVSVPPPENPNDRSPHGNFYLLQEYDRLSYLLRWYFAPPLPEPAHGRLAPFPFPTRSEDEEAEQFCPNGIDGVSGKPLLRLSASTMMSAMVRIRETQPSRHWPGPRDPTAQEKIASDWRAEMLRPDTYVEGVPPSVKLARQEIKDPRHFCSFIDIDLNAIEQARWAVVVRAQEDVAVLKALWPLIDHRMRQMGFMKRDFDFQSGDTSCGAWLSRHTDGGVKTLANAWGEVPPVLLVRTNERVDVWLARHGVSQRQVDPTRGVPFYLLIASRPGPLNQADNVCIPWSFQYELDMFWGVGRLAFSDENGWHRIEDYRAYAEGVVAWEQGTDATSRLRKEIAFFATRHDDDPATRFSADEFVRPLIEWSRTSQITTRLGIGQRVYLGHEATRDNLGQLLRASTPPALLLTATHGIGLPMHDPKRLVLNQGALVTADFQFGSIKPQHWMSGADLDQVSNLNVQGMIAMLYGSYTAGSPQFDELSFDQDKPPQQIAPFPFVAQLPQRLLAKGALAVLGHIGRAWPYALSGSEQGVDSPAPPFQEVIDGLLRGDLVGSAVDRLNVIQAARSLVFDQEMDEISMGVRIDPVLLSRLWMARNDARNNVLLGDPAVRLAIS